MSLSKPFPLIRLPRLPLFKVFNYIGVQEQKLHIQNLKISSTIVEDEIVGFVLDNCRAASEVHLNCPTTPGFDYLKKTPTPKFSLDKLTINYAEWVTTRHLTNLFINCKHVILDGCDPKNLKIKQFIKKWVYEYSQLKYASLTFDYADFSMKDIMRWIPSKRVPTRTMLEPCNVYCIKQQKTGAQAYVIRNHRTILITDSLQ
ncbi:hypothetical protein GCK72_025971 [Caenorhabditis remanei]|uniref:Sdz-33 F-box domain-containing protein n=1 Tax=Caenorhabditis remanei TaxID=31234 RepID=A0A6A5G3W3_CAERE|nr:hypothetical protein GCK72_025971 [Caenorhabditis remanei]KAF1749503.1 hypothetical protein GCK72_025971 [Caenorhabditis remanei]